MKFQVFQPHPFLSGIFRNYIVQQGIFEQEVSTILSAKGVGAILFPFNQPLNSRLLHAHHHFYNELAAEVYDQPILIGNNLVGNKATYLGSINMIFLVFQATGIHYLLRGENAQVTNRAVAFDHLHLPPIFQEAQDRLWGVEDGEKAVRLLESYFLRYFSVVAPPKWQHDLGMVAHHIERTHGQVPVHLLAKKFRVTPRALEKSFLRQVGTTPKEYSRVMRFKAAMQYIKMHPGTTWLDIVATFHYTDQSHLIREFRQFSGYTPARLFGEDVAIDQQLYLNM